jgi:UDP-glucose 4-epimerase
MKTDAPGKKTVMISGANGYFGTIACDYFSSCGWNVLKAARREGSDMYLNLEQPENLVEQRINHPIDLFIHAAAAHEVTCRDYPYQAVFQNVIGTKAVLDFCVANNIQNFIYLSTFHVFGNPKGAIDEMTLALPENDYGLSHLQAEEYVQMYTRLQKIHGTVLRPSNFFGIPANLQQCKRWSLTPLSFCREAVEKQQIILKTTGFQKRNFISILDICATIRSIFDHLEEVPLLHIPGPDTLSIRELAKIVQRTAEDSLNKHVELIIPEGHSTTSEFIYESRYLHNFYQPTNCIEAFAIEFCKQLSSNPEPLPSL